MCSLGYFMDPSININNDEKWMYFISSKSGGAQQIQSNVLIDNSNIIIAAGNPNNFSSMAASNRSSQNGLSGDELEEEVSSRYYA